MVAIVTIPHPALRKVSDVVSETELGKSEFKKLLADLSVALRTRDDGVGLSAPQIAVNKRVFVVSGKVFDKDWMKNHKVEGELPPDEYFINPVIVKSSKKLSTAEEGCLSIPNTYGMVKRPSNVTLEYIDQFGETKTKKATALLSRIFQHEIDHLDGILFTDKATELKQQEDNATNQEL
jgi:peptide deformylase